MAEVMNNDLTEGIRGRVGKKMVFRQVGNRTIISTRPRKPTVFTEKQIKHRERFQQAIKYAKNALLDPATKNAYTIMSKEMESTNAFAAAIGDFLKAPVIESINLTPYTGVIGNVIPISVVLATKVITMKVTITGADGSVIETGDATQNAGEKTWNYVTTKANDALPGTKVTAVATDRPGNSTTLETVK